MHLYCGLWYLFKASSVEFEELCTANASLCSKVSCFNQRLPVMSMMTTFLVITLALLSAVNAATIRLEFTPETTETLLPVKQTQM